MATLTLSSWFIQNNETGDTVANDVNPKIRKLAFGDKYEAFFTYVLTDTSLTTNTEIRFNPGMFVKDGFQDATNLGGTGNESYGLRLNTVTTTFQDMVFFGPDTNSFATGSNETYQIKKINGVTFQIKMTFFMTADTASYLGVVTAGQYSRLTSDRFTQSPAIYNNTNTTNYTNNASLDTYTLGLYCSVTYRQAPSARVVIDSAAGTITTSPLYGIDFIADGWDDPCGDGSTLVEIKVYRQGTATGNSYVAQANLILGSVTSTTLVFSSLAGFPNGGYVIDIEPVFCTGLITYGVLGDNNAKLRQWDWLNIDGLFPNEGNHTNRSFLLLRAGNTAQAINATLPTDIQFDFTYTGTPYKIKYWIIPSDMGNSQTAGWFDQLQRPTVQFTDTPVPVNLGGNNWRMTQTIDPITLGLPNGGVFHFLYVVYDAVNNYYASYVFPNVNVNNVPEFPSDTVYEVIPITGQLHTYKNAFATDYLNVSPLQRVAASVTYDKATYNLNTNFNRVSRVEVTLERSNGQVLDSSLIVVNNAIGYTTDPRMQVINSISNLQLLWILRLEHEYSNQELVIRWKMISLTEPTETIFLQKFLVDDYQQNLDVPDQDLTAINFYLNGILVEDFDRNCDADDVKVETIKDPASPLYYQAAVWLDEDLRIEEYDGFNGSGTIPLSTNPFQFDVEEEFGTSGTDNEVFHWITNNVNTGEVGMIGYPPPLPVNVGRVMLHHTNPNGRNITFAAQDDIAIGSKIMVTLGGTATSGNFTFRIGTNSAILNDANNANWSLYPSISFATLLGTAIPMNTYVRVEYNGSFTANSDIVTYLDYFRTLAPAYPRVMPKTIPSTRIAANDIMLYPGTTTSYLSVGTPSTTRFTEARTAAELVANADLTDFQTGEFAWNSGLSTTAGHIYLQPGSPGGYNTVSIALSSLEPNIQLTTFATPLTNEYYPSSGNGVNTPCITLDKINDTASTTSALANAFMDIWAMPIGTQRTIVIRQRSGAAGNGLNIGFSIGGGSFGDRLGYVSAGIGGNRFQAILPSAFVDSVNTYIWRLTKPVNFGTGGPLGTSVEVWVNGKKTALSAAFNLNNMFSTASVYANLIGTNVASSGQGTSPKAIEFVAFFDGLQSLENIRKMSIGSKNVTFGLNPQYAWDYTQIVSTNQIPFVGSLSAPNLVLANHTNTLGTLWS